MNKQSDSMKQIMDNLANRSLTIRQHLAARLGTMRDKATNQEQMKGYMDMKSHPFSDPSWQQMLQERGMQGVLDYIHEMEGRLKKSERQSKLTQEDLDVISKTV